jgi:aspartate racemase
MPVVKWLKEVQEQQVEVRQYEHSPLSLVQTWSEVPGGERLFDSMISFQNFPLSTSLGRASQEIESIHTMETSGYPLTLSAEVGEELSVAIKYDLRFFDTPAAARIGGHLQTLLESFVANPQQTLARLSLLTFAERDLLLTQWNHSPSLYASSNLCIHELFEEQARLTPHAVAIVSGQEQVSYAELNVRANRLAHYLRSLGVGPEITVGLCLERSPEMVVALLGILKAGGAYVPLDPQYPRERLAFMLEDARVRVLITEQGLVEAEAGYEGVVVCLEAEAEYIKAQDERNPESLTTGDNLAYVIYTSGSTGQPKGVSVVHRGVVRLVKETQYTSFSSEEVFLLLAPVTFDASTFEVWGSLLNGARLVVMPPHAPSLQEIGEAVQRHGVTTLWLTSGLFNLMVDERLEDLQSLRQILTGGEALSMAHAKKFLATGSNCRFINCYGPTENTTFSTCYTMHVGSIAGSAPIGYPIAHTEVYILDEKQRPVPVGVPGELYLGGDGLARGYANRSELTAEKFVPHPCSVNRGERLYRTGDMVKYLPDGSIEFLGRRDKQVKVRGFRIELGEIEAVLGQHPQIREALVIVREDAGINDKRLVAYVVAEGEASPETAALRSYLAAKLPDYMVPQAFVLLGELPLTANGKVDRRALPAPTAGQARENGEVTGPRTETERAVAEMWREVLGVCGEVSVEDNFFTLGGHSLLATRMMSQVRKRFGVEVGLRGFFEEATVEGLARLIELAQQAQIKSTAPTIIRASREHYRMSSSQQGALVLPDALRKEAVQK